MEEMMYNLYSKYFGMLQTRGYYPYKDVYKLLVLDFIYCLIYHDYRGYVSKEDYCAFERALECLYGTSCLTPYPDYLKMGRLKLGEMAEIISRLNEKYDTGIETQVKDNTVKISAMQKQLDRQGCNCGCEDDCDPVEISSNS